MRFVKSFLKVSERMWISPTFPMSLSNCDKNENIINLISMNKQYKTDKFNGTQISQKFLGSAVYQDLSQQKNGPIIRYVISYSVQIVYGLVLDRCQLCKAIIKKQFTYLLSNH